MLGVNFSAGAIIPFCCCLGKIRQTEKAARNAKGNTVCLLRHNSLVYFLLSAFGSLFSSA